MATTGIARQSHGQDTPAMKPNATTRVSYCITPYTLTPIEPPAGRPNTVSERGRRSGRRETGRNKNPIHDPPQTMNACLAHSTQEYDTDVFFIDTTKYYVWVRAGHAFKTPRDGQGKA